MRFLVDTNILIWALAKPGKLSSSITHILENEAEDIFYSQMSLWEISIKYGLGKLDLAGHSPEEFLAALDSSFMRCLGLENDVLASSHRLTIRHKDPFDRMIIWQCLRTGHVLLSADKAMQQYEGLGLKLVLNE
ncbi:MAG: type II toxin-antitoxin system VapC family toxin [Actinomycetia bacterium]|nr:type II toxin-antitoxin system VapC family toxin [Actinomycetes bacterium]